MKRDLEKGKTVDPLQRMTQLLFKIPFSRILNRSETRSTVTGLLLLGIMLRQDSDFTRIYSGGEWVGSRHPWDKKNSTHGHLNIFRQAKLDKSSCAKGLWYAFSIQPDQVRLEYPKERWVIPTFEDRQQLIRGLTLPPLTIIPDDLCFEDRRLNQFCELPDKWNHDKDLQYEDVFTNTSVVVLRPPRSLQKKQLEKWLGRLASASKTLNENDKAGTFILADLSPFQAITYAELINLIKLNDSARLDIYLVTEDWAVCCFSKSATNKTIDGSVPEINIEKARRFLSGSDAEQQVSALAVQRLLRYADSYVFWKPVGSERSLPSDVYFHGVVSWSSSYDHSHLNKTGEKEIFIRGYLDLTRALADIRRYQACHRALRRCLNLFPEFDALVGDDFVDSITLDADRGRRRIGPPENEKLAQFNKKVIIGSIHVTSSTVDRFLKRAAIPQGSQELYIFNHPDSLNTSLSVLDWFPPVPVEPSYYDHVIYKRIPNTPYIGPAGEKTIPFPRFRPPQTGDESLTESLYKRTPAQTYEDFYLLNALRMGHWVYEKSHDLLTINLYRALELSNLDNGPLIEWLVETVKKLCFDGDRWKNNVKMLYPSHALSDQMVSLLKQRIFPEISTEDDNNCLSYQFENNMIPLKFLASTNSVSPFRISPLSYERLKKIIKESGRDCLPAHVILLDDGTLSGKTFKELEQLAFALGAQKIETVALVDRTGLPVYYDYVEEYLKTHHCFWRWDVPTLGYQRGCPLCIALENALSMEKDFPSEPMLSRLKSWQELWRPVEVVNNWENHGLNPKKLIKENGSNNHAFGIYSRGQDNVSHFIHHKTSTGITAAIVEITFLTSRSNYALKKARKAALNCPEIGIEILAAQILLFFDELEYWPKVDLFCDLLSYLWECEKNSETTALAGLCLTLLDNDLLPEVWPRFKENQLSRKKVLTDDANICAESLRARYNRLCSEKRFLQEDCCSENPSEEERFNYLVMFANGSLRLTIARIFDIIGEARRTLHNMGLQKSLDSINDALNMNNLQQAYEHFLNSKSLLESLTQAFEGIDLRFFSSIDQREKDLEMLGSLTNTLIDFSRDDFSVLLSKWKEETDLLILGEENGFAERYRSEFIYIPKTTTSLGAFLKEIQVISKHKNEWPRICSDKIKCLADRWHNKKNPAYSELPEVINSNREKWSKKIPVYCDRYVKQCLFEVLSNCVHVELDIPDPWEKDSKNLATMWWKLVLDEDFITVKFVNACNAENINLNPTEASSSLARMGGDVVSYVIKKSGDSVEAVSIPKCPLPLDRLIGLPANQRIALTVVRIPTMNKVKKG